MSSDATGPPDLETLARIEEQLEVLIPEAKRWRRTRLLTWLTMGALAAVVIVSGAGWWAYQDDRQDDAAERAVRRAANEQALVRECEASADQTADLRTAINVLVSVAVDPSDPEAVAAGRELNARLDEAVPPRDCVQEARNRSPGG